MSDWPERLDRFIERLRQNRRPELRLARTLEEIDDLRMAARLAGIRSDFAQPDPAFMQQLREQIGAISRPRRSRLSRSRLVRVAGLWVAGLVGGIGLDRAWQRFQPVAAPPSEPGPLGGHWHPVAHMADLPVGVPVPIEAGGVPGFIVRDGDTVRGLSRVCTHMGCLLQYRADGSYFQCPCHGALFDLQGRPDSDYGAAILPPLPPLEVRVARGTVYVLGV